MAERVLSGSPHPSPALALQHAMICPLSQTPEGKRWGLPQGPTQQAAVSSASICNKAMATPGGAAEASAIAGPNPHCQGLQSGLGH